LPGNGGRLAEKVYWKMMPNSVLITVIHMQKILDCFTFYTKLS
jgi:hypothetical protein